MSRKTLSLVLAAVIAFTFTVPAFGAGTTPAKKIAQAKGNSNKANKRSKPPTSPPSRRQVCQDQRQSPPRA
jgi:hypothetical protein